MLENNNASIGEEIILDELQPLDFLTGFMQIDGCSDVAVDDINNWFDGD